MEGPAGHPPGLLPASLRSHLAVRAPPATQEISQATPGRPRVPVVNLLTAGLTVLPEATRQSAPRLQACEQVSQAGNDHTLRAHPLSAGPAPPLLPSTWQPLARPHYVPDLVTRTPSRLRRRSPSAGARRPRGQLGSL